MSVDVQQIQDRVRADHEILDRIRFEIGKVLVGQERLVSRLLIALIADGHILLEGVPGLAKTTAIKSLAACLRARFQRIQFTPDLLPADLLGTLIYNPRTGGFDTRKGPIFANLVLADEINRAPAKVQSALLEAMQERQVSLGDETWPLEEPFLVLATQNPIEQEGTYPLPEAQVDRFLLKVVIGYPSAEEERRILDLALDGGTGRVQAVCGPEEVFRLRETAALLYMDGQVRDYAVALVQATREPGRFGLSDLEPLLDYGASPRGSIGLGLAARAQAFLQGRGFVTPQDVKDVALDVLRHRILLSYEAEAEGLDEEALLQRVLDHVPVP